MSLRINQNISAMSAHRFLANNDESLSKSIDKLSSGLRINAASDDAAGLVISENLRSQISGLQQASRNTQDAINMIKTTEAALNEIETQLHQMRDLSIHAANANGNASMLNADQAQLAQAMISINRIADQTEFAGIKLIGTQNINNKVFQVGSNAGQTATFELPASGYDGMALTADMHVTSLGLASARNATAIGTKAFSGLTTGLTENVTVIYTNASGTSKAVTTSLNATTGDTLAHAVTAINASLNDAANIEAVATDQYGAVSATPANNTFLTIRQKTVADQSGNANVFVLSDKATADSKTGFTATPTRSTGQATGTTIDLTSSNTTQILQQIDDAMKKVNGLRVHLVAFQKNNLESNLTSISVARENLAASESAIRDTDMASEMVNFTKTQILMQSAQAMLTQANQAPQQILQMMK